jgi:hypothetical protein
VPTIPKMMMMAAKTISKMKMIKKKIRGKFGAKRVTIMARRLIITVAIAAICPILWKVN